MVVVVLLEPEHDQVDATLRLMLVMTAVILLLGAAVAWLVAGRILAPVRAVRETAESITQRDLAARIPVHGGDEMADLSRTVNAMLDRIEQAFAAEQRFVDDTSELLLAPLVEARARLTDLPESDTSRRRVVDEVTHDLARLTRTVEDLRVLAAAERPDFVQPQEESGAEQVLELRRVCAQATDRRWVVTQADPVTVQVDPARLRLAVRELARNAADHTDDGASLEIAGRVVAEDGRRWWQVAVTDDGPGVDREDAERIFERFDRGEGGGRPAVRQGRGLGLALVRAVAEAHGGSAFVESRPGSGATFGMLLPLPDGSGRTGTTTDGSTGRLS